MGKGKTREMALRVTSRAGEEASTPEYQAATMVRNNAKARTATAMPQTVRAARKGCRTVLRQVSLNISGQGPVASFLFSVFCFLFSVFVVAQAFQPVLLHRDNAGV